MTDPNKPDPIEQTLEEEVETNRALEQGLGVGARELAAQNEPGEKAFDNEEDVDDAAADLSDGRAQIKEI